MRPKRLDKLIRTLQPITSDSLDHRISRLIIQVREQRSNTAVTEQGFWRRLMQSRITKLAIASLIIVTISISIYQLGGSFDSTAFADICQNVIRSSTISFNLRVSPDSEHVSRIYEKDSHLVRIEFERGIFPLLPNVDVMLMDAQTGESLVIDTHNKVAKYSSTKNNDEPTSSIYEMFKNYSNLPGFTVKELGERTIDGRMTKGFELSRNQDVAFIWVDLETKLPILLEKQGKTNGGDSFVQTITDIVFDEPLDDSLFDFEPSGFKIETFVPHPTVQRMQSAVKMNDILKACRQYVNDHNGQWPDKLTALHAYGIGPETFVNPHRVDKVGFVYHKPSGPVTEKTVIMHDVYDEWSGGINVGYGNFQVHVVKDENEFKALLNE